MSETSALGRPTKLNRRTVERLVEMYRLGSSQAAACRYAGIGVQTLRDWLIAGRAQLAAIAQRPEGQYDLPVEAALVLILDEAQGDFVRANLANIRAAAEAQTWQASAWLLERRFPEEFGRRDRIDHTHKLDGEIERLIRDKGLDEASAARLRDFAAERRARRPA